MTSEEILNTRVLLIGSTEFPKDATIPSVPNIKHNLTYLRDCLTDSEIFGIPPENVVVSLDDSYELVLDKLFEIGQATKKDKFTLIIYFAGHGMFSSKDGRYYLLTKSSKTNHLNNGSIDHEDFKNYINDSFAGKKIVIMDCCHSGTMIDKLGDLESKVISEIQEYKGTYVMTSSARKEFSRFRKNRPDLPTFFTGKLIDVISHGLENASPYCSLRDIFIEIERDFTKKSLPVPQQLNFRNGQNIEFVKNNRFSQHILSDIDSPKPISIFLNYAWADLVQAKQIDHDLRKIGYVVKRYTSDLRADLQDPDLSTKVVGADLILFLITDSFLKSEYCMLDTLDLIRSTNQGIATINVDDKKKKKNDFSKSKFTDYWNAQRLKAKKNVDDQEEQIYDEVAIFDNILDNTEEIIERLNKAPVISWGSSFNNFETDVNDLLSKFVVIPEVIKKSLKPKKTLREKIWQNLPALIVLIMFILGILLVGLYLRSNNPQNSRLTMIFRDSLKRPLNDIKVYFKSQINGSVAYVYSTDDNGLLIQNLKNGEYACWFTISKKSYRRNIKLKTDSIIQIIAGPFKDDPLKVSLLNDMPETTTYPTQWVQPKSGIQFDQLKVTLKKFDSGNKVAVIDICHLDSKNSCDSTIIFYAKLPEFQDLKFTYKTHNYTLHLDSIRNAGKDKLPSAYMHLVKSPLINSFHG